MLYFFLKEAANRTIQRIHNTPPLLYSDHFLSLRKPPVYTRLYVYNPRPRPRPGAHRVPRPRLHGNRPAPGALRGCPRECLHGGDGDAPPLIPPHKIKGTPSRTRGELGPMSARCWGRFYFFFSTQALLRPLAAGGLLGAYPGRQRAGFSLSPPSWCAAIGVRRAAAPPGRGWEGLPPPWGYRRARGTRGVLSGAVREKERAGWRRCAADGAGRRLRPGAAGAGRRQRGSPAVRQGPASGGCGGPRSLGGAEVAAGGG